MDDKRSVSLAVADGPQRSGSDRAPLVETIGLTKRFGELVACDEISFDLNAGEIHALLGENGAGKSTLVKMLYGALEPDEGTILWRGVPVRLANPAEARSLGIGMVFQHFSLFESLNVAENILLGLPAGERRRGLADKIRTISHDYGLPLDPDATVHDLSVGERQRVEIVRCLLQEPQLIIMDEPTSVLTPQEADLLFVTLNKTETDYSPTTMYEDYAINEKLFHWQSQSTTSETSPTGCRYIKHSKRGNPILLFVREHKKINGLACPYNFLGPVDYVEHSGSRPMSIIWKLQNPMPAHLLRQTARLATA